MICEFSGNWGKLDQITKDIILEDYKDCLREDGCSEEDIKMLIEIIKYELD